MMYGCEMADITTEFVDRLAEKASVDCRTIDRYLAGRLVRGLTIQRIEAALRKLKRDDLIRSLTVRTGTDG